MAQERRSGGPRGKAPRGGGLIPQLPWRSLENPYAPLERPSEEQMVALHNTPMRIPSGPGRRVMDANVMGLSEAAGPIVDHAEEVVRIDESIVAHAISTAPATFVLTSRARQTVDIGRARAGPRAGGRAAECPRPDQWLPVGRFFGAAQTMSRYETAFDCPMLSGWTNPGAREAAGSKDALERATILWRQMLDQYDEPATDPTRREEPDTYVAKRKQEIGSCAP